MPIKRIFITGGNGMVGRNLREHHVAGGYEIFAPPRCDLDLMNEADVANYLKNLKPDLIIHCAGTVGGIQDNIERPVAFLTENLKIGVNVILSAQRTNIKRLLNIGSSCMYPRGADNPLKESSILTGELEPTNEGYAIAKIMCAKLCEYICRETPDLQYKTIIPCNLYGKYDKFDNNKSHMIPAVIRKVHESMLRMDSTIEIWGDGLSRREFMYAGELADFIFFSLERFDKLPQYLNIGLGYDYSINEYYIEIAKELGYKGNFHHNTSKPTGMKQKLTDIARLQEFGWTSKMTLKEGIAKTYEFFLSEERK